MSISVTRRTFLSAAAGGVAGAVFDLRSVHAAPNGVAGPSADDTLALRKYGKKIPVIFDTDIGSDIDDTWALLMLLNSPELDLRLVVSDYKNCTYRAKILTKMLEVCGRTEIPVGVGLHPGDDRDNQTDWVADYNLWTTTASGRLPKKNAVATCLTQPNAARHFSTRWPSILATRNNSSTWRRSA